MNLESEVSLVFLGPCGSEPYPLRAASPVLLDCCLSGRDLVS
jgi:hypothetical protein